MTKPPVNQKAEVGARITVARVAGAPPRVAPVRIQRVPHTLPQPHLHTLPQLTQPCLGQTQKAIVQNIKGLGVRVLLPVVMARWPVLA